MANTRRDYYVDHAHRVLWILPRRCASTTLGKIIGSTVRIEYDEALQANLAGYYTIAWIRHPWDRLTSALYSILMDGRSFKARAQDYVIGKDPMEMDAHVRPLWKTLEGFRIDFYGRVETLEADLATLRATYPHIRSTVGFSHWGEYRPAAFDEVMDDDKAVPPVAFNWGSIEAQYAKDFDLHPEWRDMVGPLRPEGGSPDDGSTQPLVRREPEPPMRRVADLFSLKRWTPTVHPRVSRVVPLLTTDTGARLTIDRSSWTPTDMVDGEEIFHASIELSWDGGETWRLGAGCGDWGGEHYDKYGSRSLRTTVTTQLSRMDGTPANALRVTFQTRASLRTALHLDID